MKSLILFLILVFFCAGSFAQTKIALVLRTSLKIDSVDIFDITQKEYHQFPFNDTITAIFDKHNVDLYVIRFFEKGKMYRQQIWLDSGRVTVKMHIDSSNLVVDTVQNSPMYYHALNYQKSWHKLHSRKDTLDDNNFLLTEISQNIETPFAVKVATDYVNRNQNSKEELLKLRTLMERQKADFKWFIFYEMGIGRMNKILQVKKVQLSNFQFFDRSAKLTTIKLTGSNFYILDFWFVGCAPCAAQHKEIKTQLSKLAKRNVKIIGIDRNEKFKIWNRYLNQHGYHWDNYLEAGANKISSYLGIASFPNYVILNSEGDIISSFNSISDVFKALSIYYLD